MGECDAGREMGWAYYLARRRSYVSREFDANQKIKTYMNLGSLYKRIS